MKPDSGRTIPLYFKVSPEEKARIDEKMEQLGIHNRRAYLRKMAVDGYAVRVDMADFKALVSLLRICSNNLNQIAKRVNSTGNLYAEGVKQRSEVWRDEDRIQNFIVPGCICPVDAGLVLPCNVLVLVWCPEPCVLCVLCAGHLGAV